MVKGEGGAWTVTTTPAHVFENLDTMNRPATDGDRRIYDAMATHWVNLAKRGDPNGDDLPVWPAFSDSQPVVMVFAGTPHTGPVPSEGTTAATPSAAGVPVPSNVGPSGPRLRAAALQAVKEHGSLGPRRRHEETRATPDSGASARAKGLG
jgi:hypothetical protein